MKKKHQEPIALLIALTALIALMTPTISRAETPNPTVSGPIKAAGLPGGGRVVSAETHHHHCEAVAG